MYKEQAMKVSDLGLAAALVARGHEILDTDRDINGRKYFVFWITDELTQDANDYWAGSLEVFARRMVETTKMLKTRIYNED